MKYKLLILIFLMVCIIFSMSTVCANDVNDTSTIQDINSITDEISTNEYIKNCNINDEELLNTDENQLESNEINTDNCLSQNNFENILSANSPIKTRISVSNYSATLSPTKTKFTITTLTANVKTEEGKSVNTGYVYFELYKNWYDKITFFATAVNNGVGSYNYNREIYLDPGIYTCIAYYEDYSNTYNSSSCNFYLKVYSKTSLSVKNITCNKGDIITLSSTLSTSMGSGFAVSEGYIIFEINSKTYIKKNEIFKLSFNEPGLLNCSAKYVGEKYLHNSSKTNFYINIAYDTRINYEINSDRVLAGESFNIYYEVVDSFGNPVKAGQMGIFDPNLGVIGYKTSAKSPKSDSLTVSNKPGQYEYTIYYYGSTDSKFKVENYLKSSEKFNITVYAHSKIIANSIKTSVNKQISITVYVKDHLNQNVNDGEVKVTILGKTYTAKVKNGKATFYNVKIPSKIGKYNYNIYYSTNTGFYTESSSILTISCYHASKIIIKSATGYQGKKVKLKATVKDENGVIIKKGNVDFKINGKTYTTNIKKSVASITIKYPKAKVWKIKSKTKGRYLYETNYYKSILNCNVQFKEIGNYLGSSSNFKITSKKKPIKHKYLISKYQTVTVPVKNGKSVINRGSVSVITKKIDSGTENVLYICAVKDNAFMTHYIKIHSKVNGKWKWTKWLKLNSYNSGEFEYGIYTYGYGIKADEIKIKYYDKTYHKIY